MGRHQTKNVGMSSNLAAFFLLSLSFSRSAFRLAIRSAVALLIPPLPVPKSSERSTTFLLIDGVAAAGFVGEDDCTGLVEGRLFVVVDREGVDKVSCPLTANGAFVGGL